MSNMIGNTIPAAILAMFKAYLPRVSNLATQLAAAKDETAEAKRHQAGIRTALRSITASMVSVAWIGGMGKKSVTAYLKEILPDTPRKAVNISEVFRVLAEHPDAATLAKAWAKEDFAVSVEEAVKALRGKTDPRKALWRAVAVAMHREGLSLEEVTEVVAKVATAVAEAKANAEAKAELLAELQAEVLASEVVEV